MKKYLVTLIVLLSLGCAAIAQPRAAGLRFGYPDTEFQYQHLFGAASFLEVDLGVNSVGDDGFKATGAYNWEFAHPSWGIGSWAWYAGPGATLGYVTAKVGTDPRPGFMMGLCISLGCECEFQVPIAVAVDVKPQFGYHFREGGFYDAGLLGLVPSVSVKYKF